MFRLGGDNIESQRLCFECQPTDTRCYEYSDTSRHIVNHGICGCGIELLQASGVKLSMMSNNGAHAPRMGRIAPFSPGFLLGRELDLVDRDEPNSDFQSAGHCCFIHHSIKTNSANMPVAPIVGMVSVITRLLI